MAKAKKKKGGGTKGGKGGKALKKSNYQPVDVRDVNELWVKVNFKLINWTFMNFSETLRVSTPLHQVINKLEERHGDADNITLYKGAVNDASRLQDTEATLETLDFPSAKRDASEIPEVNVYYDFQPHSCSDPLLLITPRVREHPDPA